MELSKPEYIVIAGKTCLSVNNHYRFDYATAQNLKDEYRKKMIRYLSGEENEKKKSQIRYLLNSLRIEFYKEH